MRVLARSDRGGFELTVANSGDPIPPATLERLFQPFFRGSAGSEPQGQGQEGLGLGLCIASEIARAHGAALEVSSGVAETRFTFRMPHGA